MNEPVTGKFLSAVSHISAAENAHREHVFWCYVRLEFRMEVFPDGLGKIIYIRLLHEIVDDYF